MVVLAFLTQISFAIGLIKGYDITFEVFQNLSLNQNDATKYCETHGQQLAFIKTSEDLYHLIQDISKVGGLVEDVYIGMHWIIPSKEFEWFDGDLVKFAVWATNSTPSEPACMTGVTDLGNGCNSQDCVVMTTNYELETTGCNDKHGVLCSSICSNTSQNVQRNTEIVSKSFVTEGIGENKSQYNAVQKIPTANSLEASVTTSGFKGSSGSDFQTKSSLVQNMESMETLTTLATTTKTDTTSQNPPKYTTVENTQTSDTTSTSGTTITAESTTKPTITTLDTHTTSETTTTIKSTNTSSDNSVTKTTYLETTVTTNTATESESVTDYRLPSTDVSPTSETSLTVTTNFAKNTTNPTSVSSFYDSNAASGNVKTQISFTSTESLKTEVLNTTNYSTTPFGVTFSGYYQDATCNSFIDRNSTTKRLCVCVEKFADSKWPRILQMNLTRNELRKLVNADFEKNIKPYMTIQNKKLSRTKRSKKSAPDDRTSSASIGWGAISVLLLPVALAMTIDCINCIQHIKGNRSGFNRNNF